MEHKFPLGGQAVIEGVMIKSPNFITVAVRRPNGTLAERDEPFRSFTKRSKILGLPIIRGIVNLIEMMVVGMRALDFSANEFAEITDQQENGADATPRRSLWTKTLAFALSIVLSLALAIFLFKFIPLYLTEWLRNRIPALAANIVLFNLVDGVIRILIFFAYLLLLSTLKSFRRIFEYHGAEHKTIFTHEKGLPLTHEQIQKESPRHPRCGTSFIMIVLILSILLLSLIPHHPVFLINLLRRMSFIPLIAGVSYEVLKFTAKYEKYRVVKWLTLPGILTQYITAKEPNDEQIEVAVAAVKRALALEKMKHKNIGTEMVTY